MRNAKWVSIGLITVFILGIGVGISLADGDEYVPEQNIPSSVPGQEGVWIDPAPITQSPNFDSPPVAQFDTPTLEPTMPTGYAALPLGNDFGDTSGMVASLAPTPLPPVSSSRGPAEQQLIEDKTAILNDAYLAARKNNASAVSLVPSNTPEPIGVPQQTGNLKGADYLKADEQLSRDEIKVENQITGYLKQQTTLLKDENISAADFAAGMQALDMKLATAHQEMVNFENKDPFNQEKSVQADITRENKLVNDPITFGDDLKTSTAGYKALAQGWGDGGVLKGVRDDGEGPPAGRNRPEKEPGAPPAPVAKSPADQKTETNTNVGGIWEDPNTAIYYPKAPKPSYPSQQQPAPGAPGSLDGNVIPDFGGRNPSVGQQPASAAPAGQESVYSKDRGPGDLSIQLQAAEADLAQIRKDQNAITASDNYKGKSPAEIFGINTDPGSEIGQLKLREEGALRTINNLRQKIGK